MTSLGKKTEAPGDTPEIGWMLSGQPHSHGGTPYRDNVMAIDGAVFTLRGGALVACFRFIQHAYAIVAAIILRNFAPKLSGALPPSND